MLLLWWGTSGCRCSSSPAEFAVRFRRFASVDAELLTEVRPPLRVVRPRGGRCAGPCSCCGCRSMSGWAPLQKTFCCRWKKEKKRLKSRRWERSSPSGWRRLRRRSSLCWRKPWRSTKTEWSGRSGRSAARGGCSMPCWSPKWSCTGQVSPGEEPAEPNRAERVCLSFTRLMCSNSVTSEVDVSIILIMTMILMFAGAQLLVSAQLRFWFWLALTPWRRTASFHFVRTEVYNYKVKVSHPAEDPLRSISIYRYINTSIYLFESLIKSLSAATSLIDLWIKIKPDLVSGRPSWRSRRQNQPAEGPETFSSEQEET